MREWKRKAYEENTSKILTKNTVAYYIKYKYNLTGDEMKKYGNFYLTQEAFLFSSILYFGYVGVF